MQKVAVVSLYIHFAIYIIEHSFRHVCRIERTFLTYFCIHKRTHTCINWARGHAIRGGGVAYGWLWLVGSIKLQVSFAKEPYKRDIILQKRPIILSILLTVATPYIQKALLSTCESQIKDFFDACLPPTRTHTHKPTHTPTHPHIHTLVTWARGHAISGSGQPWPMLIWHLFFDQWLQPIAFGVSFNLNLQSQSRGSVCHGTCQKRPRELDYRLKRETTERTL